MLIITTTGRRREREFAAYQDGCDVVEAEYKDALDGKDVFIGQQSGIIQQLIEGDYIVWDQIPDELRNALADYV